MRRALLLAFLLLGFAAPAHAITVDVSDDIIRVTTGFNGAGITVFGTQARPGQVVIVVEGPARTMTVRRKARVAGLYTNTDSREFLGVPSFYEVAAAGPLTLLGTPDVLRGKRIGLDNITIAPSDTDGDAAEFTKALIQMQQGKHLFVQDVAQLEYPGPQLFKARFNVPAIVSPGEYKVSAYLFNNGQVIEQDNARFVVVPEGLSANLRRFATQYGLLYGIAGIAMAMFAGWLATVLLKRD